MCRTAGVARRRFSTCAPASSSPRAVNRCTSAEERTSWWKARPPPPPGRKHGPSMWTTAPAAGGDGTRPTVTCSTWPTTAIRTRSAYGELHRRGSPDSRRERSSPEPPLVPVPDAEDRPRRGDEPRARLSAHDALHLLEDDPPAAPDLRSGHEHLVRRLTVSVTSR